MGHPILAEALVARSRDELFAFLADLRNHWALADRWIEVLSLDLDGTRAIGGRVKLRGPLGSSRIAQTRVERVESSVSIAGSARFANGTAGQVCWTLTDHGEATWVRIEARVVAAGQSDRMLLALGGRRWLERRLAVVLRRLAATSSSAPSSLSRPSFPEARA